ncbi:MAG TPA: alpha-2-macroglobulin family protein [Chloroflexota bacterium]|nr:alpha-2-macroglobulin family protein [Chloroflexota bacterium]
MSQEMQSGNKRKRNIFILAITGLTIVGLAVGAIWLRQRDQFDGTFSNPILRTNQITGGFGVETAVTTTADRLTQTAAKLQIRLSEGQAVPQTFQALPPVTGDPLTEAEIAQILARLPELTGEVGDSQPFRLPDKLLPPPRPGQTITQTFPPPPTDYSSPEPPTGPLQVLRYSPEGDVGLAPFINVTFNQPMVPLTDLESLAAQNVPVNLTPSLPGTWQWVSPQTLRFEVDSTVIDRLPMATEFVAEIPAGTTSMTGGQLAETVRWTFSTPPVRLVSNYPNYGSQPLEPIIFIEFDQLIEPTAVLPTIQLTANGNPQAVRLAASAEIAADEMVSQTVRYARDGYWLALRPERPLPTDAAITVTIGPGTPSAEGPRLTTETQSFSFSTYPPLRIEQYTCGWYDGKCPPLTPFIINFNNPLDPEAFLETMIRIEPELPGATVDLSYSTLTIQGVTKGRTTYRVTIDGSIQDIFGQTLGDSESLRFEVGTAEPFVSGPNDMLVTLDPSASEPQLTLYVMNYDELRVQAYAVTPADWPAYMAYRRNFDQQDSAPTPPGRLVYDETVATGSTQDVLTETAVKLTEALENGPQSGGFGHLVVVIQPPGPFRDRWQRQSQTIHPWVQATQIGLDVTKDNDEMVVWATDLQDGAPLSFVTITSGAVETATDAAGLARFTIPSGGILYLVGQQGDDTAILPYSGYYWDDYGWQPQPVSDELRWHILDDRAMYRPGEEVHVKGWLRHINGRTGAISLPGSLTTGVIYQVYDPQGNELASGETAVNGFGGFDLAFTLPENSNLGTAYLNFQVRGGGQNLPGSSTGHQIQIQEFRRPEFEVSARQESVGPYVVNDAATVAVAANYFAGGPLPNAQVNWTVTSTPGQYSPPGWSDFTFGEWIPWWWMDMGYSYGIEGVFGRGISSPWPTEQVVETFSGVTDGNGEHFLQIDFTALEGNRPFSVNAEAGVMDVNRQVWASSTNLLVHPSSLYVGLRSPRTFVKQGEPLEIEAIVTDIDGNPVAGTAVTMQAARLDWTTKSGRWVQEAVDVQDCVVTATTEPVTCTFTTTKGGTYEITAVVTDSAGRPNQSKFTRWVSGGTQPVQRDVEHETATLIPDRQEYQPGDVAEILVQSPFSPAEGLLILSHGGILSAEPFQLTEGTATLQIPITEEHIPNIGVQVELVGSAPRTDDQGNVLPGVPPRPAYASGSLNLSVPAYSRELTLNVVPQATELEPGADTAVTVTVTDANGQPVPNAEVALWAVDEAILALTGYQLSNPLNTFYQPVWAWLEQRYGRDSILLVNPETLAGQIGDQQVEVTRVVSEVVVEAPAMEESAVDMAGAPAPMATMTAERSALNAADVELVTVDIPIQVRTNFDPLAVFAPTVQTDANGQAQISFKLPDNLTRYRLMAAAVAGERQFGAGESNLTARLPLMVRASAPRFLNFGDQFELPVVLQNQTSEPMAVDVALQTSNLQLTGVQGQRVTIPANDRIEVRFPATTVSAGTARFQVAAVSGPYADAATIELPVYTPATTEAFATYGVLDAGAVAQPFLMPSGVITGYGGLEIGTSSTALQALTDAVLYLTSYRYESSEALASRILAIAALRDVLTAFDAEGLPTPAEMETAVQRDIETLQGMQNGDGGFPYWERGRDSIPFNSIHVAHALVIAQQKGYAVPADMQARVMAYLGQIERYYPEWYGQETRWGLSAYALYVRHLAGDSDAAKAGNLLNEAGLENLPLETLGWLWPVLATDPGAANDVAAIRQHLNNRAVETAGAANFTTSYGDGDYLMLHSDRRTDGAILNTLITQDPQNDLIPKVVNGLLAHRTAGHWGNTQENVFILLALDNYFNTFEAQTPDFVAQIWLGDSYAGDQQFVGRTTERYQLDIPMSYLASGDPTQDLIVSKDGEGRLYYRLALNYAPSDLTLEALDRGFVVQRSYEAVDDPEDVYQDADGNWHIRLGARVRVKLMMVADNRRYHVALVDPLPAGLEPINTALAVSQSVPRDANAAPSPYWWWWGSWYDHENMRDERLEAFSTLLWEGVYEYSYVTRATTPGRFVTPPAKAEEMYAPEVYGRSASDLVIIE